MKVIISVPGRFHIFNLARELYKKGYLKKIITGSPLFVVKNENLPENFIYSIPVSYIYFLKSKLRFLNHFIPYSFEAVMFDYIASRYINGVDIFHGFPNWMLKSSIEAKKRDIIVVAEGSSTHILHRERLLSEEYKKLKIPYKPHDTLEIKRQIQEYEIADYIFAASEFVRKSFIEYGINEEKIIKIHYGVDDIFFKEIKREKKDEIIIVSTIGVRKGTHLLLEAYRRLKKEDKRLRLHLLGFFREDMREIIEINKDIIDFIGSIKKKELPEYFSKVDIFVQMSLEEGFSIMILEAMASELPVVVSENTGTSEIIDNGKDGFVLKYGDVEGLYVILKLLVSDIDLREKIGKNAREKAKEYNWERYGERCIETYERIIKERKN